MLLLLNQQEECLCNQLILIATPPFAPNVKSFGMTVVNEGILYPLEVFNIRGFGFKHNLQRLLLLLLKMSSQRLQNTLRNEPPLFDELLQEPGGKV